MINPKIFFQFLFEKSSMLFSLLLVSIVSKAVENLKSNRKNVTEHRSYAFYNKKLDLQQNIN